MNLFISLAQIIPCILFNLCVIKQFYFSGLSPFIGNVKGTPKLAGFVEASNILKRKTLTSNDLITPSLQIMESIHALDWPHSLTEY